MPALNSKPEYKTCYHSPWALVATGGIEIGKRPRTRRMFINEARATDGKITGYRGFYCDDMFRPVTNVREIRPDQLLGAWQKRPGHSAVARRKKALSIVGEVPA